MRNDNMFYTILVTGKNLHRLAGKEFTISQPVREFEQLPLLREDEQEFHLVRR